MRNDEDWDEDWDDDEDFEDEEKPRASGRRLSKMGPASVKGDAKYDSVKVMGPFSVLGSVKVETVLSVMGPCKVKGSLLVKERGKIMGPLKVSEQIVSQGKFTVMGPLIAGSVDLGEKTKIVGPLKVDEHVKAEGKVSVLGPATAESYEVGKLSVVGPIASEGDVIAREAIRIKLPVFSDSEPVDVDGWIRAPSVYIGKASGSFFTKFRKRRRRPGRDIGLVPFEADIEADEVVLDGVAHYGEIKSNNIEYLNGATSQQEEEDSVE